MTSDPFVHSDAAYAMGALDGAERAEFEAHLETCPACQDRVREARGTLAFLGPALEQPAFDDEPMPDTLLPGLLRRARREQRRRRTLVGAVAGVAAACLVALVVAVWPGPAAPAPRAQALRPLVPASFVSATAALRPRSWGTEIDVRCKYAHRGGDGTAHPYGLQVIDTAGHTHGAGTWTQSGEQTVVFVGGTEVRRERIAKVQVTLADGTPILQLTL